jgi:hypothetical protein
MKKYKVSPSDVVDGFYFTMGYVAIQGHSCVSLKMQAREL